MNILNDIKDIQLNRVKAKYYKCKNKIQSGGGTCDMTKWKELSNSGQKNCGIFINEEDPLVLMKCGSKIDKSVIDINATAHIFPHTYEECENETFKQPSVIMEKLDGDITHIYFNILVNETLNEMYTDTRIIQSIKTIFNIKTPFTLQRTGSYEKYNALLTQISESNLINIEMYDNFITNLFKKWDEYYKVISKEIIKIKLKLLELGYDYTDMKYDNFGYKLEDVLISGDYRGTDIPRLFGKYFYVFCLDWDSGLTSSKPNENSSKFSTIFRVSYFNKDAMRENNIVTEQVEEMMNKYIKMDKIEKLYRENEIIRNIKIMEGHLIRLTNDGLDLSVNGQHSIIRPNPPVKQWNEEEKKYNPLPHSTMLNEVLEKNYTFSIDKYKHNFVHINQVIAYVYK